MILDQGGWGGGDGDHGAMFGFQRIGVGYIQDWDLLVAAVCHFVRILVLMLMFGMR